MVIDVSRDWRSGGRAILGQPWRSAICRTYPLYPQPSKSFGGVTLLPFAFLDEQHQVGLHPHQQPREGCTINVGINQRLYPLAPLVRLMGLAKRPGYKTKK